MKNRNVCAGLCALILLFSFVGSSCQKPEEESYLPVYVDFEYSCIGASLPGPVEEMPDSFKRPVYNTDYYDETVPKTRTEIINGREVTLNYINSFWYVVAPADYYENEEEEVSVYFSKDTGKILTLSDFKMQGVSQKSEEELIKIATEFAESKWPVFKDKNYVIYYDVVGLGTPGSEYSHSYNEVTLFRSFDGLNTDEEVGIWFSSEGEVVGWKSCLRYPDGAPEGMDQKAMNLKGRDIFVKSAVHFLREQAAKGKEKVKYNSNEAGCGLVYGENGALAVRVNMDATFGKRFEASYSFIIPVPDSLLQDAETAALS